MPYTRSSLACSVLVLVAGCVSAGTGAPVGGSCRANSDCASGMCEEPVTGTSYCTTTCTTSTDCDPSGTSGLRCDSVGQCIRPCVALSVQGSGAGTQICDSSTGLYVPCSTVDAATHCMFCGCEPFGGGMCIDGTGCVQPLADGEACTSDARCSSGVCYRDTMRCGPPRAMGGTCTVDAECATQNCSTDGAAGMTGHCNQTLGSDCTAPTTGNNVTATCNDCLIEFGFSVGVCLRNACDPTRADHCANFAGHEFRCDMSTNGTYHCYEWCPDDLHRCFYDTVSCYRADDYCR